jgi:hypothetical protein
MNDVAYYPDTFTALADYPLHNHTGVMTFNNYFPRFGKHSYFCGEGYYVIEKRGKKIWVESHPEGNPVAYEHEVLHWPF